MYDAAYEHNHVAAAATVWQVDGLIEDYAHYARKKAPTSRRQFTR